MCGAAMKKELILRFLCQPTTSTLTQDSCKALGMCHLVQVLKLVSWTLFLSSNKKTHIGKTIPNK